MISEAETLAYRQRLLALMGRLDSDRSRLKEEALRPAGGESGGGLSNVPLHLADLGSHGFEEELTLGLLEGKEQFMGEIDAALDRLDRGTYGRCEACRQEIPRGRLEALPYARYCVACAQARQARTAP